MNNEAKNVVIQFLTAVQQGDNATLVSLLSPSVQWHQAGNNRISDTI